MDILEIYKKFDDEMAAYKAGKPIERETVTINARRVELSETGSMAWRFLVAFDKLGKKISDASWFEPLLLEEGVKAVMLHALRISDETVKRLENRAKKDDNEL